MLAELIQQSLGLPDVCIVEDPDFPVPLQVLVRLIVDALRVEKITEPPGLGFVLEMANRPHEPVTPFP